MSEQGAPLTIEQAVGQRLLIAFAGKEALPEEFRAALREYGPAGVTLFRSLNVESPEQVRRLTAAMQAEARQAGLPPLLIGADQEGGQLMAIGEGVTPLPGNMALGATRSADLARKAGEVLGRELAAMGVNVDNAPSCDVNLNPQNPVIGTRSFGEDPRRVGELAAAMVAGIQSQGVAAAAKHFPGHGDTSSDSHLGVPAVRHSLERLNAVELPPFAEAIRAGAQMVMTAHIALPAVDGRDDLPATLSPHVLRGLLREGLGFEGVIVTDAMDMHAIRQGEAFGEEAVRAAAAGADLLLLTTNPEDRRRAYTSLLAAVREGRLAAGEVIASARRVLALKQWLARGADQPGLDVLACAAHQAVADQIAAEALTCVRDRAGLLPLRLSPADRVAVVLPRPIDLTPADTSSYVTPALAQSLRRYHSAVEEYRVSHIPGEEEIARTLDQIRGCSLAVVGTLNAYTQPAQVRLVKAVLGTGVPTVVAALRLPYDLAAFPEAPTYLCTYSLLEPSMRALADGLFGKAGFPGQLPVTLPQTAEI